MGSDFPAAMFGVRSDLASVSARTSLGDGHQEAMRSSQENTENTAGPK